MAHLTQLWNGKLKNIRQQGRDNTDEHGLEKKLRVTWDDPNFGQGEKVHEELFANYEEALDYAIGIGIKYDLRKRNGKFHSVDPELSRFKSGFSPIPETSAVYSGFSNDTPTWLWAPRLYTSSGLMLFIIL